MMMTIVVSVRFVPMRRPNSVRRKIGQRRPRFASIRSIRRVARRPPDNPKVTLKSARRSVAADFRATNAEARNVRKNIGLFGF
ncbi:MAG: hypothetical protein WB420_24810 [Bradyrhizobium sp.]